MFVMQNASGTYLYTSFVNEFRAFFRNAFVMQIFLTSSPSQISFFPQTSAESNAYSRNQKEKEFRESVAVHLSNVYIEPKAKMFENERFHYFVCS